jgi:hypothetical protein
MRIASRRAVGLLMSIVIGLLTYLANTREAMAVPSFARKYQTSCLTCHTVYPVLNPFGEAFRRNGYRFPSQGGSVDSDVVKSPMIALGQEEYKKTFPQSVWPAAIPESVPLSVMVNGESTVNFPDSDAHTAAGNTFGWGGVVAEFHLFAAGSFSDTLTYFSQVTIPTDGPVDIETAYLLWNDVVGPAHAVNVWLGRLFSPSISSFGLHSDYLTDNYMPPTSIVGLYNPTGTTTIGAGHSDGIELNGILMHRFDWSIGWIASTAATGLSMPNAEDVYAHIGIKSGGVALDGEGKYGPNVPDPAKPWAERSITVDAFAYHGINLLDNGTGTVAGGTAIPVRQADRFEAVGGSLRALFDDVDFHAGLQFELHHRPYPGSAATPGTDPAAPFPGVPNYSDSKGLMQYGELDYVVYPWLVPGIRYEYTRTTFDASSPASLLRVIPGVAMLVRPDIRVILTGDIERAYGLPFTGSWDPAGGKIVAPGPGVLTKFEAETITLSAAVAF